MLCNGIREDGDYFYVYLQMTIEQLIAYEEAVKNGKPIDFREFGEILDYGEGKEPSSEEKKSIEEKHNIDHDFEDNLRKNISELVEEHDRLKEKNISTEQFLKNKLKEFFKENQ